VLILFFTEPFHHVNVSWIALFGAFFMLMVASPHDVAEYLEHVEWDTLVFFGCLFIMIEGMSWSRSARNDLWH
jgi:Na+/H+ antiporter NhaD/arsenite permease-like protein